MTPTSLVEQFLPHLSASFARSNGHINPDRNFVQTLKIFRSTHFLLALSCQAQLFPFSLCLTLVPKNGGTFISILKPCPPPDSPLHPSQTLSVFSFRARSPSVPPYAVQPSFTATPPSLSSSFCFLFLFTPLALAFSLPCPYQGLFHSSSYTLSSTPQTAGNQSLSYFPPVLTGTFRDSLYILANSTVLMNIPHPLCS